MKKNCFVVVKNVFLGLVFIVILVIDVVLVFVQIDEIIVIVCKWEESLQDVFVLVIVVFGVVLENVVIIGLNDLDRILLNLYFEVND